MPIRELGHFTVRRIFRHQENTLRRLHARGWAGSRSRPTRSARSHRREGPCGRARVVFQLGRDLEPAERNVVSALTGALFTHSEAASRSVSSRPRKLETAARFFRRLVRVAGGPSAIPLRAPGASRSEGVEGSSHVNRERRALRSTPSAFPLFANGSRAQGESRRLLP